MPADQTRYATSVSVEVATGSASPEEAAAIVAALSRHHAQAGGSASGARVAPNAWQRAALREGVERAPHADVWGGNP